MEWIKTSDRLPENGQEVFISKVPDSDDEDYYYDKATYWDNKHHKGFRLNDMEFTDWLTHWCIISPPKQD